MAQMRPAWFVGDAGSFKWLPTPLWRVHCMERLRREWPVATSVVAWKQTMATSGSGGADSKSPPWVAGVRDGFRYSSQSGESHDCSPGPYYRADVVATAERASWIVTTATRSVT